MHLVFLNQYYPPDAAPTGVMLEAVVERLAGQGHEVTVICVEGGYAGRETSNIERRTSNVEGEREGKEVIRNETPEVGAQAERRFHSVSSSRRATPNPQLIHILRVPATRFGRGSAVGKLADYATFYLAVTWKLVTLPHRPDRVIALTTPPYLAVLARLVSKLRGADHAHWVMDLYPDVMVAHGMLAEGGWKHRLLAGFARWGFGGGRCAAILTLGPDMAERVGKVISDQSSVISEEIPESGIHSISAYFSERLHHQPSTIDDPLCPIEWVALWGSGERVTDGDGATLLAGSAGVPPASSFPQGVETKQAVSEEQDAPTTAGSETLEPPDEGRENVAALELSHQLSTINYQLSSSLRARRGWGDDDLVVMYSGNMGRGHRFGEFLEAALRGDIERRTSNIEHWSEECGSGASATAASSPDLQLSTINHQLPPNYQPSTFNSQLLQKQRFVFYGGGKRRKEIETFMLAHPECRIELHDYAPANELIEHLRSADVHLASLDAAWTGTMVPSKLQGIFAVGRPVIFVGSPESSIGRWVVESGGGWVVAPDDVDGLLTALDEASDAEVRIARGDAARKFSEGHFDRKANAARVAEILSR